MAYIDFLIGTQKYNANSVKWWTRFKWNEWTKLGFYLEW